MITVGGRTFSAEILGRISQTIRDEQGISRRQLSRRVCEWLDWRNAAGRLQEMSCRKVLLELDRRNVIRLPAVRKHYAFQKGREAVAPPVLAEVECVLEDLGGIEMVRVISRGQSALWRGMMDAHHYLRSGPLCGAQIRYLVWSERYGWIGGLSYSACSRRVERRDAWIGWTEEARLRNHPLVVNNSRFLIVPTVRVKCLASYVLAKCQARLGDDWEQVYRYRPVLLESYVERGRFAATCYRAANWKYVGHTTGRGRQGTGTTVKDIYLMPLGKHWQAALCRCPDGKVRVCQPEENVAPRDWVEAELGGAQLGDRRLTARLLEITGMFYGRPVANIPQATGSAKAAKAAYRFLDNERVHWQAVLKAHYEATEERVRDESLVLVVQDTTTLNYSTHPHTQGLGPIGTDSENVRGLVVHDTMAFTGQGTPLGLVNVQCWSRGQIGTRHERYEKSIEEKESWKWIESYQAVAAMQDRCRKVLVVVVADREADIHELFAEQNNTRGGPQLLIRAERSRNRKVVDDQETCEFLWTTLERQPAIGTREILIPPGENRAARQATLTVRSTPVVLRPPKRKKHLPEVRLWAVLAQEAHAPTGVDPLEWMLLSTVEVKNEKDAYQRLEWYARRWGIECYHRILKSGCRIEARQLESAERLCNALAIDMIVAWRIHYLTTLGQETPDLPCTVYFTDAEWKALITFTNRTKIPPDMPPSLNEAVRLLGKLGGYLARNGDGHPGSEVLWRGMARLADIEVAYQLYH